MAPQNVPLTATPVRPAFDGPRLPMVFENGRVQVKNDPDREARAALLEALQPA